MNLKNLLLSVAALAATPLFAATYYVTPEGAGTKDGSSWENAFDTEGFREQALKNADGDVYELAAGVYTPQHAIVIKKGTYAIINGAEGAERTILNGSQIEAKIKDNVNITSLIKLQTVTANGNTSKPAEINNIDFTSLTTNANTDSTNDSDAEYGVSGAGALFVYNSGYVTINSCNFYENTAEGTLGGAAAHLQISQVKFIDCVFFNNEAQFRGGAVRVSSNTKAKGNVTFENCILKNNINHNQYGGAIFMGYGKSLNLVNCVLANNEAASDGAAIYVNGKDNAYDRQLNIINCTIAGNTITGDATNGQIVSNQTANIRTINSIIVSNDEKTADFYFKGATANSDFSFKSDGYNYVGSVIDEAADTTPATRAEGDVETAAKINWQPTDNVSAENTYASIFGENKINSDNVIVPVKYFAGASGEEVKEATEQWGLPADVDVTKDQNGTERTEGMMPGAYAITQKDIDGTTVSVINVIDDAADAPRLVKVANGVYTVEGATEGVTAYTVNGATVAATSGNTIDLSSFANGLYIIKSGNAIFKVMK